jgi:hypothetical protein
MYAVATVFAGQLHRAFKGAPLATRYSDCNLRTPHAKASGTEMRLPEFRKTKSFMSFSLLFDD